MNYYNLYNQLISKATARNSVQGYSELHHILPRAYGGTDTKDNLVRLTAREHFIAHLLLAKMYGGKMVRAAFLMSGKKTYTNRTFSKLKEQFLILKKETTPWNKGKPVGPCTKERKELLSRMWKGKPKSKTHCENISKGKLGHTAGMTGKRHSDETKKKMSDSMKGERGPQQRVNSCPKCHTANVSYRHIKFCKNN